MPNPLNKKKAIRNMRPVARNTPGQKPESHLMAWDGPLDKRRGNFSVFPTITPKKGKEKSSDPKDWTTQTPREAAAKGELIKVNTRRKAEKLAAGSWKKGQEKRDAMKEYRAQKKK